MQVTWCLSLALLFLANVISSYAQTGELPALQQVRFTLRGNLTLQCARPADAAAAAAPVVWLKNGTELADPDPDKRYKLFPANATLMFLHLREEHQGQYSCGERDAPVERWQLTARPLAKLPENTNVVEESAVKIVCKLFPVGQSDAAVTWSFLEDGKDNWTLAVDAAEHFGERLALRESEQKVKDGELELRNAARGDAGQLRCEPRDGVEATTTLRVKDKFAALWPFLGICAEVLVLCAVILLYERRRTKPELDDSDTDNHDQKKS